MTRYTLLCAALLAPLYALADEIAALDPMVVTATRTEVAQSRSPASVTVITREQIEHAQATDLAELLRFTAGIELGRSGGPGQQTSIFIRGANSAHTLVLVDGHRINRLAAGGATLENISPDMIDRIEIVRGPRATLYGSDAIGGVINIITRRAQGANAELRARGGSQRTADGAGFLGYRGDAGEASLQAQHQRTDGIPAVAGQTARSGFRQDSFSANAGTHWAGVSVEGRVWDARSRAGYIGFDPVTFTPSLPLSHDLHDLSAAADLSAQPAQNWRTTVTPAFAEDRIDERQSSDFLHSERPSLDWHNVLALGPANRLSFGSQLARERVDAISFGTPVHDERRLQSAYVQDEIDAGAHHGLVAGSAQHNQAFGTHYNWNAEYGYDLFAATRLFAAAGTAFHAPTALDRFGFGGNPDLKPEQGRSYELGATQQFARGQSIDLRAFRSDITNLINLVCDASFNCSAINVGRFRNTGAEVAYRLTSGAWSADFSATLQNPHDRSDGTQLVRRAKRIAAARVTRRLGEHYVGLDMLAVSRRPDFDLATGARIEDGGYALLNLTGGVQLGPHFHLDARVENLLDKDYQTAAGYNQPGRSFFGTLRYTY